MLRTAEIVAVGSELLTAHKIDTNSLALTAKLNAIGLTVTAKAVVGDERATLADCLRGALRRADVVITTGGLGPTDDDLTRDVVAEVLGRTMSDDVIVLAAIEERFTRRGVIMPAVNRRQAQVPQGATVLPNANGTAPGLWLEEAGRIIVLLPGPPREMTAMVDEQVMPRLAAASGGARVYRRVLKITGRSESQVEEVAQPIYSRLVAGVVPIQTTILASPGQIELHLSSVGVDEARIRAALEDGVRALADALGPVVFTTEDRTLESVVGSLLHSRGWRLAAAESCTGGLFMGRLTTVAGSSAWLTGGIVAYANAVKVDALGVADTLIAAHGAVSDEVAVAMAQGVRRLGAEVGVGITGIAGPGGGSAEKPVGTVSIAVSADETRVRTYLFPGDREAIRRHATAAALDLVRRTLCHLPSDTR